jgi:amino acid permease
VSPGFWLLATAVIIVPLSFMKTLDALKTTSQIALSSVAYMVVVVVGWYFIKGPDPNRGAVEWARFGTNTLAAFPVQVFAFTCAQNLFPIYNELKDRTQAKMNVIIASSIFSAAGVYEVLGIVGYLTFGSKVGSNVIAMYPAESLVVAIGRLGIVFLVGLSYPLQALPCRSCIYLLTSGIIKGKKHKPVVAALPEVPEETEEGGSAESSEGDDESFDSANENDRLVPKVGDGAHGPSTAEMPRKKFIGFTIGILTSGYAIAYLVDELDVGEYRLGAPDL